jgi:hypothetical protein
MKVAGESSSLVKRGVERDNYELVAETKQARLN